MMASDQASTELPVWRRRFPVYVVGVVGAIVAVAWLLPEELLQRGFQVATSVIATTLGAILLVMWGLFLSGATWRARSALLAALVLVGVAAAASVRRVEFSGDMVPEFDLRWTESREEKLEQHRKHLTNDGKTREIELAQVSAEDAPEYRGIARDGVITGPELSRDWSEAPPKELWKQPVGGGYAAFVVVGDTAITIEQRRDEEAIVAYDVASGQELWAHTYPALFHEQLGGDGPRATPTIANGRVYSLGATGVLCCLDGKTGKPLWQANVLEENQSKNIEWGLCSSPLVYDGMVVVIPGSQKGTADSRLLVAYDAESGKRLWGVGEGQAAYSSAMLATIGGERQIVVFDAVGLAGFAADGSRELWRFPWKTNFDNCAAQPIVLPDGRVFLSSEAGCALVAVTREGDAWKAEPQWNNRNMKCVYANPVVYEGHIYGLDQGILACLDLESGKKLWKGGRYGHGQLLLSGDLLVVLSEEGDLALVEANPERHVELGKIAAIEGKTWNNPALVRGKALVRNHLEMACYELPLEAVAEMAEPATAESTATESAGDSGSE
jgi:outer membrane protein assembly factor BamB